MGIFYTSFKKKKRNKLPRTKSLLEARANHRKYLISLGIDPDRRINKNNFRVIPNWWEVGKSAAVAQQVEQLICNHQVGGSIPSGGTRKSSGTKPQTNWRLEESQKFTVAPAYNKGAYQVITRDNVKDIGK
tara:strand:+ start:155 stop:547 length:393 start_codon:yes stop_codon:yes gene_type:complete